MGDREPELHPWLARSAGVRPRIRRRASSYTSVGLCLALSAALLIVLYIRENADIQAVFEPALEAVLDSDGRRLDSLYPRDPIIDYPYKDASNKYLCFIHVILIGYMLLGLNTICDVYFTGALDIMVEKWDVKPDVAGATFMAAGGSAPELFTSLVGTCIAKTDVGFGTIVGSAVFNVLFVIGICGFAAKTPIKLTWWPLFRDCSFYMLGLSLLAICASDQKIELWEAIILFSGYLIYCLLMYNNETLEAFTDREYMRAKRTFCNSLETMKLGNGQTATAPVKPDQVAPMPEDLDDNSVDQIVGDVGGAPVAPSPELGSVTPETNGDQSAGQSDGAAASSFDRPRTVTRRVSISHVHGKMHAMYFVGHCAAQRHDKRMEELGIHTNTAHDDARLERSWSTPGQSCQFRTDSKTKNERSPSKLSSSPSAQRSSSKPSTNGSSVMSAAQSDRKEPAFEAPIQQINENATKREEPVEEGEETECEDDGPDDLMEIPEDLKDRILWYLSLPIYVPVYYLTPLPSEKWFLLTFAESLIWIAGFSFFMVWWFEIIGDLLRIDPIVLGLTVIAAGTSIPDAVSSVAVARMGEGDMAVSSSIGSNIFDILVGLPIPWIVKIGIIELGDFTIPLKSEFLTFYVLLLLFMVSMVVISIHLLGWVLNRTLGAAMASLYASFLICALSVEFSKPSFLKF